MAQRKKWSAAAKFEIALLAIKGELLFAEDKQQATITGEDNGKILE